MYFNINVSAATQRNDAFYCYMYPYYWIQFETCLIIIMWYVFTSRAWKQHHHTWCNNNNRPNSFFRITYVCAQWPVARHKVNCFSLVNTYLRTSFASLVWTYMRCQIRPDGPAPVLLYYYGVREKIILHVQVIMMRSIVGTERPNHIIIEDKEGFRNCNPK